MPLQIPYVAWREKTTFKEYQIDELKSDSDGITLIYTKYNTETPLNPIETPLDPSLVLQLINVGESPKLVRVLREFTAGQMAVGGKYNEFRSHFYNANNIRKTRVEKFTNDGDPSKKLPETLEDMTKRLTSMHFQLEEGEKVQTGLSVYK